MTLNIEKYENKLQTEEINNNINDFYKGLKDYCKNLKKQKEIPARRILGINKKELIIFEAKLKELQTYWKDKEKKRQKVIMPQDRIFLEIPSWTEKISNTRYMSNLGGFLIFKEPDIKDMTTIYSFWIIFDINKNPISLKPLSISFYGDFLNKEDSVSEIFKVGGAWNKYAKNGNVHYLLDDEIKKEIGVKLSSMLRIILEKFSNKEYTKYKKWTPSGTEEKEIIYSYEVSKHRRHFWKDSGRFKIPLMSKEELKEKGYGIDELVIRDGEIRRDVPYKIIGDFIVGKEKEVKKENKRYSLFSKRILRQEQKVLNILKEIFPNNYIKRHDRKVLKGLELDFLMRERRLGIEYDGEQHFDKKLCEEVFKSDFEALQKRDRTKDKLCKKRNMTLIRIKYDEPLTKTHIKNKLKSHGVTI